MVSILYFHSETEITYHSVCRFQNLLSCNVFSKGAATLEGALRGDSSIFYVFFLCKKVDILQKLDPLSFTFGLVTHLTHHVLKLTHSLALFEGAAIVERRACGTDAFLFLSKLGIWAATTEKCQYSCEVSKKTIYLKHLQNHAYKATENCVCGQTERVLRVIYFLSPQRFHHFCGVSHEITA